MHANMKLGKYAPRHDPRTLQLANYLGGGPGSLPSIPSWVDYSEAIGDWKMYANDRLGDCTCAAAAHLVMAWTKIAGKERDLTDTDVIKMYEAVSGYTPADPSTDNGAVEIDVLNYWRNIGIGGDKLGAYAALEPQNTSHVKLAVALYAGCYIGLALPISAQSQRVWSVPPHGNRGPGAPGSWGGHAVPVVGYDHNGLTVVTWGGLKRMTWGFWHHYCVAPETRVLTADLRWVSAGDVKLGDNLLAFDENGPARKWKASQVLSTAEIHLPCSQLTFSDGTRIVCSNDHQWLTAHGGGSNWIRTDQMRVGGKMSTKIVKPLDVWLLDKFNPGLLGQMSVKEDERVALVERKLVGVRPVAALKTSTGTFIAEGLASHNCDEAYALFSTDYLVNGKDPLGVDVATLKDDLELL